jgi:DNA gyrase/topoisomerase IV subunit B
MYQLTRCEVVCAWTTPIGQMRRAWAGAKVEVSRFKGLGEMPPAQLKTDGPGKADAAQVMASNAPYDK